MLRLHKQATKPANPVRIKGLRNPIEDFNVAISGARMQRNHNSESVARIMSARRAPLDRQSSTLAAGNHRSFQAAPPATLRLARYGIKAIATEHRMLAKASSSSPLAF